jgi:hypothetical protein
MFLLHVLTPLVRVGGGEGKLRSAVVAKSYNGADLLAGHGGEERVHFEGIMP